MIFIFNPYSFKNFRFSHYDSLLPPHSQWFNHLFDQLGIGFFHLFFVAEWIEGICYFCLVVFVALALGQLAFAGLFFGTFAVVLDIVAELVGSAIPVFGKAYDMAFNDGIIWSKTPVMDCPR